MVPLTGTQCFVVLIAVHTRCPTKRRLTIWRPCTAPSMGRTPCFPRSTPRRASLVGRGARSGVRRRAVTDPAPRPRAPRPRAPFVFNLSRHLRLLPRLCGRGGCSSTGRVPGAVSGWRLGHALRLCVQQPPRAHCAVSHEGASLCVCSPAFFVNLVSFWIQQ